MNTSFSSQNWSVWRASALFFVGLSLITGCTSESGDGTGGTEIFSPKLVKATDCGDLEHRLKTELVHRYERQSESFIYYGWMDKTFPPSLPTEATTAISGVSDVTTTSHSETRSEE